MKKSVKIWIIVSSSVILAGIVLMLVFGFFIRSNSTYFGNGNRWSATNNNFNTRDEIVDTGFSDVNSLDLNVEIGILNIEYGDSFKVEALRIPDNYSFSAKAKSNSLEVIFKRNDMGINNINIDTKITITVPKDFELENLTADTGVSTTYIKNIVAKSCKFKTGVGSLEATNINFTNMSLDNGVGESIIDGIITGKSSIKCGVGEVVLNLKGNEEDYSYDIKGGVGEVNINNSSYSSLFAGNFKSEAVKDNSFDIICGVGTVNININD